MVECRCFWNSDGKCSKGKEGPQATCPEHAYRINAETGEKMGPLAPGPETKFINGDPSLGPPQER